LFELSEGDVRLPKLFRYCSTALVRRRQNSGHRTGCMISRVKRATIQSNQARLI